MLSVPGIELVPSEYMLTKWMDENDEWTVLTFLHKLFLF